MLLLGLLLVVAWVRVGTMSSSETGAVNVPAAFSVALAAFNQQQQRTLVAWDLVLDDLDELDPDSEEEEEDNREIKRRRVYPRKDYNISGWAIQLQELKDLEVDGIVDPTSRPARRFRESFRLPYPFFVELVALVKQRDWFPTGKQDASGRRGIPVQLKVLACLQILARGNCFADIYHMSFISMQTAAATFHRFTRYFAREMYAEHIFLPTGDYQKKVMTQYDRLGFSGATGSTDVTHIPWGMCPYNQARSYTGKEGYPTVAYQVTVDHTKRVLAVTPGFTGSTNDKSIIRYDTAVTKIREDPIYSEKEFTVYEADGTPYQLKGCYLLVDNGYHKWVTLIPPSKYPIDQNDLAFSKRLESVRKDVECFFGIVKGRFRILKLSIPYHKQEDIDNVFFTCCILHNMLHSYDNKSEMEEEPNWAGNAGLHNAWEHNPSLDLSSVGAKGSSASTEDVEVESGFNTRRKQLIASFVYRKSKNDIAWLS
ncbi:unnamed protein product [Ectocarpus sp. CCAP 1310/34]|nr:unnamed protein product [Ectocarpus sp. CCAP 1310/34]CAB1101919.1 unnamed protein product [Ectocarpus sp. CCAP 1310/34]CAB1105663.1 unnamed protein product [Ectocarpus sp. CCAP 1310/34]